MQNFLPMPSEAELRKLFAYNAETGRLHWAIEPRPARPLIGTPAGTKLPRGNVSIRIGKLGFRQMHRIIWVMHNGPIPDGMEVDHIDQNPANNRISNLRLATSSQQKMNKGAQSNNRSGLKGAYYHACRRGKKWRSQIKVGSRLIFLGYHGTALEAHKAYAAAASTHFGEFDGLAKAQG